MHISATVVLLASALLLSGVAAQLPCGMNTDCNNGTNATTNCCSYNSVSIFAGTGSPLVCIPSTSNSTTVNCMNATASVSTVCSGMVICVMNKTNTCYGQTFYAGVQKAASLISSANVTAG
jgi:hypothetical protein